MIQSVNRFGNIDAFVKLWDSAAVIPARPVCSSPTAIVPRSDPRFWKQVESGIQPLVRALVDRLGWITYSSCEGHLRWQYPGMESQIEPCHVGVLPRDTEERQQQLRHLFEVAARTNSRFWSEDVMVRVHTEWLHAQSGGSREAVDILFLPRSRYGDRYFKCLREITAEFEQNLLEVN
jgi:hypothetical protein